jgi:sugar/nucleoside kinase (ribokinase family)
VICTLGDLLLDVVVLLRGPITADTDTFGCTRVGVGGQAANVAGWAVALGGRARVIAKRAADPAGRILLDELTGRGIEVVGPETPAGTGTVVSVVAPDGGRSMLTDRGVSADLEAVELEPGWVAGCAWLHVSGYSIAATPAREAALAAIDEARRRGARISVDVSSRTAVELNGVDRFRSTVATIRPDVLLANEDEARLVDPGGIPTFVVKRGARGCTVRRLGAKIEEHEALPAEVVDTTGAGDAFAAGFLLDGVELALDAARCCVETLGAMPEQGLGVGRT